jgi:hypothetical protein
MRTPIFVRSLSEEEREELEAGLRSKSAFTMRRSQVLLASARGKHAPKIAQSLGCAPREDARRHPRLQREGHGRPDGQVLAPREDARGLRRGGCRSLAPDAPPLPERVRIREQPVDFGDGLRGGLRAGPHRQARLRGDYPGDPFASAWGEVDAGQAVDHIPRPPVRKKKGGATG